MIAIIQCAASKRQSAGHLVSAAGKPVSFVAHPECAPRNSARLYARPDDVSDRGKSWRDVLLEYNNNEANDNPLGLLPAYQLYENKTYKRLTDELGAQSVFILSAGWGLIRADFLTPYYDITFSHYADEYKRRHKTDRYRDFCMLPGTTDEEIVFFGGKDYVPLFTQLTVKSRGIRRIFYNSTHPPEAAECILEKFETNTRTNWHYECANAFLRKKLVTQSERRERGRF